MDSKFSTFWVSLQPAEKAELAAKAKTSTAYLSQVANGHRVAGRKTITALLEADERISLSMFFEAA